MTPPIIPPQSELDLRELLAKATPGPWRSWTADNAPGSYAIAGSNEHGGYVLPILAMTHNWPTRKEANAALIVAAVNSLPELLDENARLRAERDQLFDAVEYAHGEGFEWPADPIPPTMFHPETSDATR